MQQCPNCDKYYDESEYAKCPYCHPVDDRETYYIVTDNRDGSIKEVSASEYNANKKYYI